MTAWDVGAALPTEEECRPKNMTAPQVRMARKWVEALRSGDYQQARATLKSVDVRIDGRTESFCCLGVLCEIVEPDNWQDLSLAPMHNDDSNYPHRRIRRRVGMNMSLAKELARLNDGGCSFDHIASEIERVLGLKSRPN